MMADKPDQAYKESSEIHVEQVADDALAASTDGIGIGGNIDSVKPGQIVANRYRIVREIGRGGVGVVFEAENVLVRAKVALKMLDMRVASRNALQRFQREAQILTSLQHENIVRAFDFGVTDESTPFLTMELVSGEDLSSRIRRTGSMSEKEALEVFLPVFKALAYAHSKSVVHRDLKPSNIMLVASADDLFDLKKTYVPKILDFGLASHSDTSHQALTNTGEVIGTPLYMSPEQISGAAVTTQSDIYSVGCMMFEVLTGAPPFTGRTMLETMMMQATERPPSLKVASLGQSFSPELESLVAQMLEKEPAKRPKSFVEIFQRIQPAFQRHLEGDINTALRSDPTGRALAAGSIRVEPPKRMHSKQSYMIAASVALVLGACAFGVSKWVLNAPAPKPAGLDYAENSQSEPSKSGPSKSERASTTESGKSPGVLDVLAEPPDTYQKISDFHAASTRAKGRTFEFGAQSTGGLAWNEPGVIRKELTSGKYVVPEDAELWFFPGQALFEDPHVLFQFSNARLNGLHLLQKDPKLAMLNSNHKAVDWILQAPDTVTKFAFEKLDLNQQEARALDKRAKLDAVILRQVRPEFLNAADDFKSLSELRSLCLDAASDVRISAENKDFVVKLLPRLIERNRLQSLGLIRVPLTQPQLKSLSAFSELERLNLIDSVNVEDAKVLLPEVLPRLKNLHAIALNVMTVNPAVATALVRLHQAHHLRSVIIRDIAVLDDQSRKIFQGAPKLQLNAADGPDVFFDLPLATFGGSDGSVKPEHVYD